MLDFRVTPDGGEPYTVKAGSRDVLTWEKTGKGKSFSKLMEDLPMSDLYRMAHIASRRQGLFTGSLEEFENTCELGFEAEPDDVDPTQPAHSTEQSYL